MGNHIAAVLVTTAILLLVLLAQFLHGRSEPFAQRRTRGRTTATFRCHLFWNASVIILIKVLIVVHSDIGGAVFLSEETHGDVIAAVLLVGYCFVVDVVVVLVYCV